MGCALPRAAVQPPAERYKELLSLSVIVNINAALCERHLANCPPSEELSRECGKVGWPGRCMQASGAAAMPLPSSWGAPPCSTCHSGSDDGAITLRLLGRRHDLQAKELEQATDAALAELERGGPPTQDPLCKDM